MSHSLVQFNTPQVEIITRAVDFTAAVFDQLKAGNISEAVARKAVLETILTGDCAPTARLWCLLIENHDRNNLEQISLLEPGDEPLKVNVTPEDPTKASRVARFQRERKPLAASETPVVDPVADIQRILDAGMPAPDRAAKRPRKSKAKEA